MNLYEITLPTGMKKVEAFNSISEAEEKYPHMIEIKVCGEARSQFETISDILNLSILQKSWSDWTAQKFYKGLTDGEQFEHLSKKLIDEVRELREAAISFANAESNDTIGENFGKSRLKDELADCFGILLNAAHIGGIDIKQIIQATNYKLDVNKRRNWVENPDGTFSHAN